MRLYLIALAFVVAFVYGCSPKGRTAELPQSTLGALPQSTLAFAPAGCPCSCPCNETGQCSCAIGQCACQNCPGGGTKKLVGVAPNYEDAMASGRRHSCPTVAFVNLPAQPIGGAVSYRCQSSDPAEVCVGWNGEVVESLSARATARDIEEAVGRVKRQGEVVRLSYTSYVMAPPAPAWSFARPMTACAGGNCR